MDSASGTKGFKSKNDEHIVLIHDKLAKRREDRYIVNIALALKYVGFTVTILTSCFKRDESIDLEEFAGKISIQYAAWWIPRSMCGFLRTIMSFIKAIWIALSIIFKPPLPKPCIFVAECSIVVCVLKKFTRYKVFYLEHFAELKHTKEECIDHTTITPGLFDAKWIKYADEIIVETECFAEIFKRSYPTINKEPRIWTPCIDVGLWNKPTIHINRIIPDLLNADIIFLTVGKYHKSTNFSLAIEAFEILMTIMSEHLMKEKVHMIIAGNCKSQEDKLFYNELVDATKLKACASNVSFLRQLPTIHHKTLMTESTIVLHPGRNVAYSDFIVAAMSLGKPIIATNRGIASKMLEHKISGILIEPEPRLFALTMHKLIVSSSLRMFLGEMSKKTYDTKYSFESFSKKIEQVIHKYTTNDEEILDIIPIKSKKI